MATGAERHANGTDCSISWSGVSSGGELGLPVLMEHEEGDIPTGLGIALLLTIPPYNTAMRSKKSYRHPPLIEALCEFRLSSTTEWDLTIPGLLYERLRNEFPRKGQRQLQQVEIAPTTQGLQQRVRSEEGALFSSEDRQTLVQVAPHLLAVNRLAPYPGWEQFRPLVGHALDALCQVTSIGTFEAVILRYINRIWIPLLPGQEVDTEEYFEFRPFLGKKLPQTMTSFMVGGVFPVLDGVASCQVLLASEASEVPDKSAFLLILDCFPSQSQPVAAEHALSWIDRAHDQVIELFEGCITDRLRALFEEDT
ncbi:MAG: TIGR04255 family protein [Chloroflexi bacterium]|nr:TIGR04255 family protein [Chloroflexota bacterium]